MEWHSRRRYKPQDDDSAHPPDSARSFSHTLEKEKDRENGTSAIQKLMPVVNISHLFVSQLSHFHTQT